MAMDDRAISLNRAIDAVRKYYDKILYFKGDGKTISSSIEDILSELSPAQPRWIPCGERLPEDDVEVLVTDDAGGVQWLGVDKMMSYEDGSGRFWLISQHPIAWIPLPEPYKEKL